MKISLTMTKEQAEHLSRALEIISRIGMGQFKDMIDFLDPWKTYDKKVELEDYLKSEIFPELQRNSYWGIYSPEVKEECKIACDVYQHLRRELAWLDTGKNWRTDDRDWHTQMGVSFNEPMKISNLDGKFEVERIEE